MILEVSPEALKCKKLEVIMQLSKFGRSYFNKYSGSSTYYGTLLLIFPEGAEIPEFFIQKWAKTSFKKFSISKQIDDSIKINVLAYRAGCGYHVWKYIISDLSELLKAKIKLDII